MKEEEKFQSVNPSYIPIGLAKEAVKTFGDENQIMKLFEEMAELQEAILKYKMGRDTKEHVQEELADVRIMLAQMCVIFGKMDVYKHTQQKLERLAQRIREHKEKRINEYLQTTPQSIINPRKFRQTRLNFNSES